MPKIECQLHVTHNQQNDREMLMTAQLFQKCKQREKHLIHIVINFSMRLILPISRIVINYRVVLKNFISISLGKMSSA